MQDYRMWEAEFMGKLIGTLGLAEAALMNKVALGVTRVHPWVMHV